MERIGRGALSLAAGRPIFRSRVLTRLPSRCPRRDTGRMEARTGPVLVGRGRELGELEHALDAARAGSGVTVLVAGEAGIGKTRLASELARRARDAGSRSCWAARSIWSAELPYQPFVEALRPLGTLPQVDGRTAGSQLRVFEQTLALLSERGRRAGAAGARGSALGRRVHARPRRLPRPQPRRPAGPAADDLPRGRASSAERVRRLADGVRRSSSALLLELGPLGHEELAALLEARADDPLPAALTDAIVARSKATPSSPRSCWPPPATRWRAPAWSARPAAAARCPARCCDAGLLRLAAAAGRDVGYPLLRAAAGLPERDVRESLRRAVEHGVLVAEQETGSFRFRHALLAEAVYATICPASARSCTPGSPTSWRAAQRGTGGTGAPLGGGGLRGGAGRLGGGGTPGAGGLRPGGGARAPGRRWRCGLPWRTRPSWCGSTLPSCAPGSPAGQRNGCGAARGRAARRAIELVGEDDPPRARFCTRASAATCTQAAGPKPASPRSSAQSSWCRRSRPRRSAPRRWRRSGTD